MLNSQIYFSPALQRSPPGLSLAQPPVQCPAGHSGCSQQWQETHYFTGKLFLYINSWNLWIALAFMYYVWIPISATRSSLWWPVSNKTISSTISWLFKYLKTEISLGSSRKLLFCRVTYLLYSMLSQNLIFIPSSQTGINFNMFQHTAVHRDFRKWKQEGKCLQEIHVHN